MNRIKITFKNGIIDTIPIRWFDKFDNWIEYEEFYSGRLGYIGLEEINRIAEIRFI
jgi:hypothetical protein